MKNSEPVYKSHLGVYAFIPHPDGQSVLLTRKGIGCYTGLYDMPGGGMDPHETLEQTLLRETREETTCEITHYRQLAAHSLLYPHRNDEENIILRHIGVTYLASISGTPCEGPAGGDSLGCVWVALADITPATASPLTVLALAEWRAQDQKSA